MWENRTSNATKMSIIYKITNLANGMTYIGRSNKTLEEVRVAHRYEGNQTNPTRLIGQAIKQFGIDNFTFETIEECDASRIRARHKYWRDYYQSRTNGYNRKHMGVYSVSHDDIMKLHAKGMSAKDIAETLHCDQRTVITHVKAAVDGITTKEVTKASGRTSNKDQIMQMWADGKNHLEIAEELFLCKATVQNTLRRNGVDLAELYQRRNLPLPSSVRKYTYAQVDAEETPMEAPDTSSIIAPRHDISRTALYEACIGPATHAKGDMFRRYDEDGKMMQRLYEPVGHAIPVTAVSAANPEMIQEFASITEAVIAICGTKDSNMMLRLKTAAKKHCVLNGMYWHIAEVENKRRPIYAFSIDDYRDCKQFATQNEASIALHVHQNAISRHLNYPQKYRSVGGYICTWKADFSREEWEEAIKYVRPGNAACKASQVQKQHIYLTGVHEYGVVYCSTLLDAVAKTKSSVAVIQKCLRGEAKTAKSYFVTAQPMTFDEWATRKQAIESSSPSKAVYGVSVEDSTFIITAKSIKEAAESVNVKRKSISDALRKQHAAAGYRWYYGTPTHA